MRKLALSGLFALLSFGFVGCVSPWDTLSRGLKDNREATVCGKEIAQVLSPDNPGTTQLEYRIQLTWRDVERGTNPALWSVVSEKTFEAINFSDKVVLVPCSPGQLDGHVTVIYMWVDERASGIYECKYEFDLPFDPVK